jgi:hypothetical protein
MAGFLLWFPGKSGITNQTLDDCGLADFHRDKGPEWFPLESGPDRRGGLLAIWRTGEQGRDPSPAILPTQDWQPCRANQAIGLAKGAYWIGLDKQRPLQPSDIQRSGELHPGYWLKLSDGQEWHVPTANMLPHTHGIGEDGQYERQIAARYAAFWERSREFAEQIFTALGQLELAQELHGKRAPQKTVIELPLSQLFDLAIEALAFNYRINAELATRLKLLDDNALRNIPMLIVDLPQLVTHEQKKKGRPRSRSPLAGTPTVAARPRNQLPPNLGGHLLAAER